MTHLALSGMVWDISRGGQEKVSFSFIEGVLSQNKLKFGATSFVFIVF